MTLKQVVLDAHAALSLQGTVAAHVAHTADAARGHVRVRSGALQKAIAVRMSR